MKTTEVEELVSRLESQRIQREIAYRQSIEERKYAYALAKARENFKWLVPGGILVAFVSGISAFHHKNVIHTLPIPAVLVYLGYETHRCYGSNFDNIKKEAERIISEETGTPLRPLTLFEVRQRSSEYLHPSSQSASDVRS
ncbi:hypothetical protein AB6A40_006648 [Gnathostoma spinigerum]|uniref:Uncharacterized protein n=1 Tax=Gnathostoma spinigerum TaxID=75299 RepID=A0ABD6ERM7_9BILA